MFSKTPIIFRLISELAHRNNFIQWIKFLYVIWHYHHHRQLIFYTINQSVLNIQSSTDYFI